MNSRGVIVAINLPIFLALAGAWAWFHTGTQATDAGLALDAKASLPGFQFRSTPLSPQEVEILATTNAINGAFSSPAGERFQVFMANWSAKDGSDLVVVRHSPDLCWTKAGATIDASFPHRNTTIAFQGIALPFECRVFNLPGASQPELTLWCTLVNGRVFEESAPGDSETGGADNYNRSLSAHRRKAIDHFRQSLVTRTPASGRKQFVRLSASLGDDPQKSLAALTSFATNWLSLQRATSLPPP